MQTILMAVSEKKANYYRFEFDQQTGIITTNTPSRKTFKGRGKDLEWAIDKMMMSDWWDEEGYLELEIVAHYDLEELAKMIPCVILEP